MSKTQSLIKEVFCSKRVSGVAGFFKDDLALLEAAKKTYAAGYREFDTLSPFPIHGMDDAMGLKRSPVPWFAFFFGLFGCGFGLWFQWWVHSVSWPLNIGGKPYFSLAAYVPIIFEMTVLFGALLSVAGMFLLCGLPKVDPPIIDPDITCHKFAIFVPQNDVGFNEQKIQDFFKSIGATEIKKVAEF